MPKPRKRKACRESGIPLIHGRAELDAHDSRIRAESADEIERLRAEIARLQERANRWIHNFELLNKEFCDMELRCEALIRERDEARRHGFQNVSWRGWRA